MLSDRTRQGAELVLRRVFFAGAPLVVGRAVALVPVTGALLQVGLALLVFFAGEAMQRVAARSRFVAVALRTQLAFESYYRAHAPRPFLYYVAYPLLFPYWLAVREARQEFLLFKGYTLPSFALLVGSLVWQYARNFPPELTLRDFAPIAAGTFLVETVVVLMFLMPLVTTVVHFHTRHERSRLALVLGVAMTSVLVALVGLAARRDPVVSYATRVRVGLRAHANPSAAARVEEAALKAAWRALPKERDDVDRDGKVEGTVLDAAHGALGGFFKEDEGLAFDLWYTRAKGKAGLMVLYFEARGRKDPLWLAMTSSGALVRDPKQLPKGAFAAMWRATQ